MNDSKDYQFIAQNVSEISRIPISVYQNTDQICYCSPIKFITDPALPYVELFLSSDIDIRYYITPTSFFYGVMGFNDYKVIIGPCCEIPPSKATAWEYMSLLDINEQQKEEYYEHLKVITCMPLQMFLHMQSLIYYFFSGVKIEASKIRQLQKDDSAKLEIQELNDDFNPNENFDHTTLDFENKMLKCIKEGNSKELLQLFASTSVGKPGHIGNTYLRQLKNIFIASATLASRAAIQGGIPVEEALTLSDDYINTNEKLNKAEYIMNLQYKMIMDFTNRVESLRNNKTYTKPVKLAMVYIRENASNNPSIDDICNASYLSKSQLSLRFKEETGITITDFIREQKIFKAKELLQNTNMTPLDISIALGFSSQSHFQKVFKDITGLTPKEYKNKPAEE